MNEDNIVSPFQDHAETLRPMFDETSALLINAGCKIKALGAQLHAGVEPAKIAELGEKFAALAALGQKLVDMFVPIEQPTATARRALRQKLQIVN